MDWKPLLQNRWLLVLGALGIALLVVGSVWSKGVGTVSTLSSGNTTNGISPRSDNALSADVNVVDPALAFENLYDTQLTTILDQISGVNAVHVMVTLDATETLQLAERLQQTTQQQGSGKSSTTINKEPVTIRTQDGSDQPVVVERLAPAVRGVLVTVNANDFYVAKSEIIDAITNVLDVPAYKISVEPQK